MRYYLKLYGKHLRRCCGFWGLQRSKQAIIDLIEGDNRDKIVQYFLKSKYNKDILGLMYQIIK